MTLVDVRQLKVGLLHDSGAAQHQTVNLGKGAQNLLPPGDCLALHCHITGVDLAQLHNDYLKDATAGW